MINLQFNRNKKKFVKSCDCTVSEQGCINANAKQMAVVTALKVFKINLNNCQNQLRDSRLIKELDILTLGFNDFKVESHREMQEISLEDELDFRNRGINCQLSTINYQLSTINYQL